MADTGIGVAWHLEYACPFRRGRAVTEFAAAHEATWRLRAIDQIVASGDVYGDLAVHGTVYAGGTKSPLYGIRIGEAVTAVGGLEAAQDMCGSCPANALRTGSGARGGGGMAGCCGWLRFNPADPAVDAALHAVIAAKGLRRRFEAAFPKTKPIGYRLWIASPLGAEQLDVLAEVLPDGGGSNDPVVFRRACGLASEHRIPLHVRMSPPGHTDFGVCTTFPHCPRCKRGSGERWEKTYSTRPQTCPACGQRYVPADTAASEPMSEDDENPERLERMLTPDEFRALRLECLRRHDGKPKDRLEQLMSGEAGIAEGLIREGAGVGRRPSILRRFLGWLSQ
jgi:hypothetical protein